MKERKKILIVDDMEVNRVILSELFNDNYITIQSGNGKEALEILKKNKETIAVVLLDIVMPEMDGYEFLNEMKRNRLDKSIPVIIITSWDKIDNKIRAFSLGADDVVIKPFEPYVLKMKVENIIRFYSNKNSLEKRVKLQEKKLEKSYQIMIDTLSSIIEHRNMESGQHILRIRLFTKILLAEVSKNHIEYNIEPETIDLIASASLLHDVGKIVIPDSILNKPGRLTQSEFEMMKTHCIEGCKILDGLNQLGKKEFLNYAYNICRYHHERWDGGGYPDGLEGDDIPIYAQVAGVADVYDALVNQRIYKPAFSHEKAVDMILKGECGMFSPKVLKCFNNIEREFYETSMKFGDESSVGNDKVIISELVDVLSEDFTFDMYRNNLHKFEAIIKYIDATILEINIDDGRYKRLYPNFSEFSNSNFQGLFSNDVKTFISDFVHQDYRNNIKKWLKESFETIIIGNNQNIINKIFKIYNNMRGDFIWNRISILKIKSDNNVENKVFFIIKSLEDKSNDYSYLDKSYSNLDESNFDNLTKLYNKQTVKKVISDFIKNDGKYNTHALFLINIDNLKFINENYGYIAGDKVLAEISNNIKVFFKDIDIVGRIDGNKLIVLMKNISDKKYVKLKANKLLYEFQKVTLVITNSYNITLSIGISLYNEHGKTFESLIDKASLALKVAKSFGENQYRIYSKNIEKIINETNNYNSYNKMENNFKIGENFNKLLPSIFYENEDSEKSINIIIDLTARHYNIDYVMAYNTKLNNTKIFKWSAKLNNEMSIEYFPSNIMREIEFIINKKGILISNAIDTLPDILNNYFNSLSVKSLIINTIKDDNYINGLVCFIQYDDLHTWSEEEIEACKIISKLYTQYSFKEYAKCAIKRNNDIGNILFDSMPFQTYIVNESYNIVKANLNQNNLYNQKCYKAFYDRVLPCENCPIKHLSKVSYEVTTSVYDEKQNINNNIKANLINYNEFERLYLLIKYI